MKKYLKYRLNSIVYIVEREKFNWKKILKNLFKVDVDRKRKIYKKRSLKI